MNSTFGVKACPVLRFAADGRFRIVQFSDTHWAEGGRNPAKESALLEDMARILDAEKPHLVVFAGDIVTSAPAFDGLDAVTAPIIARGIPWAAILGNHDDEYSDRSRPEIVEYLENKTLSLTRRGPSELGGTGTYSVGIKASDGDRAAAVMYFLDSGAYTPDRARFGFYAWVSQRHVEWFRQETRAAPRTASGEPLPSLVFLHIPLPEYREAAVSPSRVGNVRDSVCAPELNSGFFVAMLEAGGVLGSFAGHDHDNDFAATVRGVCLAYGRKTGRFSYLNHLRSGARVIELTEGSRSFLSWIRTGQGLVEDRMLYPQATADSERSSSV